MSARDPETLLREVSWLRRLARSLAADANTADDVAGDALLAWSAAREPVQSVRSWLATVLRHASSRRHRRSMLQQRSERAAARPEALPGADEAIARTELHRAVVDAVLALREPYRSAVVLRFLDELPLAAVARRLQVPAETARTRIKRGLELLRERLDHRYGDRRAWAALLLHPAIAGPSLLGLFMTIKSLAVVSAVAAAVFVWLLWGQMAEPPLAVPVAAVPDRPDLVAANPAPKDAVERQPVEAEPQRAASPAAVLAAVVRGRAVDEATLLPLPGVTVGWQRLDADVGRCDETSTTGSDGCFILATGVAAPADHLVLLLRQRDRALTTKALGNAIEGTSPPAIDVGDVTMPPGSAVSGIVRDSAGAPAPDTPLFVCLFSYWIDGGRVVQLQQAMPAGRTGSDGSFHLDERMLPARPAPMLLAAGKAGVGFTELEGLQRERSDVHADVQLLPPVPLAVRVVDEEGAGVAGARIVAEPRSLPLGIPGTWPLRVETVPLLADCFSARTGADGRAVVQPLAVPAGGRAPFTLRVEADGRDRNVVPVQLPAPEEVRIVLPKSRLLQVHGNVRDGAGRPIQGAKVAARWARETAAATGPDGAFTLQVARGDGPLLFEVSASSCFTARRELQPDAAADSVTADFTLQPALLLTGRVVDDRGNGVRSANVWLTTGEAQSTPTAADGAFTMPVPPSRPGLLHVEPPDPSSLWQGGIDHLLEPGQTEVTLMLRRLPAGRADLEVKLIDARGQPLEARVVQLNRSGDGDGLWHPATATIGRITASDLTPGEWSLRVEPTTGCELATRFTVQRDGEVVELQLVQPLGGSAHGDVVPGEGPPPEQIELTFGEGAQLARFVAAPGQELLGGGHLLRLHPRDGLTFAVVDVDPSRPLMVIARAGDAGGEAEVRVPAAGEGVLRIQLAPLATLQLHSAQPFEADRLLLQLRRPGGDWGEPMRCEGLRGRTELIAFPVSAGAWEWRLRLPTRGADNRGGSAWREGRCEAPPGGRSVVEVPAR